MTKKYTRAFREFLGVTGVVNNYAVNTAYAGNSCALVQSFHKPENWLRTSFIFHQSYEGLEFWCEIDDAWREWCESVRVQDCLDN